VLDDSRRPLRGAREAAELANQMPITGEDALDPDDPELAAFLDEFVRNYETRWLDEPIPALDGHTPRQAGTRQTQRGVTLTIANVSGDVHRRPHGPFRQ
jgi:hypothetical protein